MTNTENNKFPRWGKYPKKNPKFNYVRAKLDDTIIPKISDEDFRALSDFPLIYIYISPIQSDGRRYYYIGQTINVSRRTKEHSEKLKKEFDTWLWDTIETGFRVLETEEEVEDWKRMDQ